MNLSTERMREYLDSVNGIFDFASRNGYHDFRGLMKRFASLRADFDELKSPNDDDSDLVKCAVVGAFSCGKSKFINSLLHDEIAPVEINPLTHGLTSFRYGPREVITNEAGKVISRNKYVKDVQDISSSGSFFAVEHPMVPKGLVIIDSPGFSATRSDDAAAKKDMEQSKQAVRMADIVFFLINIEDGTISKDCLTYIRETLDLNSQPMFIVLTWGETKTESEREHVQKEIVSLCKKHKLPLEDCIPYCSMEEQYLLDNYSEEYRDFFRACRNRLFDMLKKISTFKKDRRRDFSTAKHAVFWENLTAFHSDFASIVNGFKEEVIMEKYKHIEKKNEEQFKETIERLASVCEAFCNNKSNKTADDDIADIDFHLFGDHNIIVKYDMSKLTVIEKAFLFNDIKNVLKKNICWESSNLFNDRNEISNIYSTVVNKLIKKHDRKRSVWSWGFFGDGAYDMCQRLVEALRNDFSSSSDSFLPMLKTSLEGCYKQEASQLKHEMQTVINAWEMSEKRFNQALTQLTKGF